jgi:GntR family transcriptional repressor for pyruvate dehydrogenase complex
VGTAADRAANGIRSLIVSGEYGPGDRLPPERELAQELDVSRTALREGIRRLRTGGVLEVRPGAGTFVVEIDLLGVYDIRIRLEPLAAERAALRRNTRELRALRAALKRMELNIDDAPTYIAADIAFHRTVAHASRNAVLRAMIFRLDELVTTSQTIVTNEQNRMIGTDDVARIYAAIENEHPKRAAKAMERHIVVVRDAYLRMVARERQERGLDATTVAVDRYARHAYSAQGLHSPRAAV